jgi:hypothetical protein
MRLPAGCEFHHVDLSWPDEQVQVVWHEASDEQLDAIPTALVQDRIPNYCCQLLRPPAHPWVRIEDEVEPLALVRVLGYVATR